MSVSGRFDEVDHDVFYDLGDLDIDSEDGALYLSSSDSEDDIARAVIDIGVRGGDGEGDAKVSASDAKSIAMSMSGDMWSSVSVKRVFSYIAFSL